MKRFSLVTKISCVLFLLIVTGAVVLTMPLYKSLVHTVSDLTESACNKVTELTGLTVSYESFSPSVLSSLSVRGVVLKDGENKNVVSIKNTRVNYKISSIFKQDFTSLIRAVNINGVDIDINSLITLIRNFIDEEQNQEVDLEQIMSYVPKNVIVQNVNLIYDDETVNAEMAIKEIGIFNSQKKDSIDFMMESNAKGFLKQNNMNLKGNVYINGSLSSNLENSLLYISFSDLTNGAVAVNKLNLLAMFKNNVIDVHTIQAVNPLSIGVQFDIKEKKLVATLDSENLNPMSVVSMAGKSDIAKILKTVRLTIGAEASFVLDNNGTPGQFAYKAEGKTTVPDTIIPGGALANFKFNGSDKKINVSRLGLEGKNCSLNGALSFVFNNLQVDGNLSLEKYVLPNGTIVSTDFYFDPLDKGFMVFSPQVFLGDKAFTALQAQLHPRNDSFDFEFEISDYSHFGSSEPGVISLNGSYLTESNFIQSSVSFNRIYVTSIMEAAGECLDAKTKEQINKAKTNLNPYMFTGDAFISTNFNSVSYNIPYVVMANTEKENQLLFVALNGNDQTVQLDRFDLIFGKFAMNASGGLDIVPGTKDMTFYVDANSSSIPYHLQGAIAKNSVKVVGDYGTDVELIFGKNKSMAGHAFFDSLPVSYEQIKVIVSSDSNFKYSEENGPELQITKLVVEENDASSSASPKLVLTGNGTKYGIQLNSISYTDAYSTLDGTADINLNMTGKSFDSAGVNLVLKDPSVSGEEVSVDLVVSNPDQVELTPENILNSLYVSLLAEINHFSLNRFMAIKNSNNEITSTLSLSGTMAHPYALVNVQKVSFLLANEMVSANGSVMLEDRDLTIDNFEVIQSRWKMKEIKGNVSIKEMIGELSASFETSGEKNIVLPMKLQVKDSYIPEGKFLPDNMLLTLSSTGLGGTMFKKQLPFEITAMYSPDFISFFSNDELGFTGTYTKEEGLYSQLSTGDILGATVTGSFNNNDLDIKVLEARADLSKLIKYIDVDDMMDITSGVIQGEMILDGTYDTPEFFGKLEVLNPVIELPSVFSESLSSDNIVISAKNNEIELVKTPYYIGKNKIFTMDGKVVFNKWVVDSIALNMATLDKKSLPLRVKTPLVSVSGEIDCDLNLFLEDNVLDVNGKVFGEKVNIVSNLKDVTNINANDNSSAEFKKDFYVRTKLDVLLGTHVMLNFNPLLRCIFAPNTRIGLNLDSLNQVYEIDGKLNIKSGDVAYVNRSFYIKEGVIEFNPLQINNPQITLRAETREKDDKGQNVRIILSAEKQYLLDFNPRFSSIPGKSENEIYNLLGQVVIADLDHVNGAEDATMKLLTTAGGFAFQSVATRHLENKLRESLNFDIFSLRTNFIQNIPTLINPSDNISVGNFLDVSTVYIGKYLGSAMYADAMLNLSVADSINNASERIGKDVLLQPEIGFEFALPFSNNNLRFAQSLDANFRVGMEGDFMFKYNDIDFKIVPSVSMSLLWRF